MSRNAHTQSEPSLSLAIRLRYWQAAVEIGLMRLLALLPLTWLRAVGAVLGTLLWPLARERRLITLRNLELCFPERSEQERQTLARANFRSTAIGFMETAKVWFTDPKAVSKWIAIEGLEHLTAASAKGKGVLVLGFHLTDLELGAVALSQHCKLAGMYRPHADPVFERAMRQGRERHFPLIPRDDVRGMLRWLKQGGCVWYAADQDYGAQHSVFAPFFGTPAATITATSRFAKLSGAVVLPFTHVRTRQGIRLVIHPALTSIPSGDELADTLAANRFLEQWLRQHPADYLWLHRRFKTRPAGEVSLYPQRKPRHAPGEISGKRCDEIIRSAHVLVPAHGMQPAILLSAQGQLMQPIRTPTKLGNWRALFPSHIASTEQVRAAGIALLLPQDTLLCSARNMQLRRFEPSLSPLIKKLKAESSLDFTQQLAEQLARLHSAKMQLSHSHIGLLAITPEGALGWLTPVFTLWRNTELEARSNDLRGMLHSLSQVLGSEASVVASELLHAYFVASQLPVEQQQALKAELE